MRYDLRHVARRIRDSQWAFMERLAREGILHVCPWCKNRSRHAKPNELVFGLIDYMEFAGWITEHPAWFRCGAWDDRRQTRAYWLTPAGRAAIKRRPGRDDLLPIHGGLVSPGWRAVPRPFHRDLMEQRQYVLRRARGYRPTKVCAGELRSPPIEQPVHTLRRQRRKKAA